MTARNVKPNASMAVQAAVVALGGNRTGASVAIIGGESLYEGQVDACIAATRRLLGLEMPGAWRRWLAGGDMMLVMDLAQRGLARSQYIEGIRACLLRAALAEDVAHDVSLPADDEVLGFLKEVGVVRRKAKLHDVPEYELQTGREALDARRKAAVFDERIKAYRESVGVEWADGWIADTS